MLGGWDEVFDPSLRWRHEEELRRLDDRHEVVVSGPASDDFLEAGMVVLKCQVKATAAPGSSNGSDQGRETA